eukprot:TRINITY_DN9077_c0_g2_i3.p1 TRINITY_DN9077_c0_g2~~TRINITY_DN9077_c0_g2_i3.p1  ORF type:complete len:253 (+),score=56.16 TRINITY_DN9077_c0_g2_i3:223-981(+)
MVRNGGSQTTAKGNPFDLILFSESPLTILDSSFKPIDGTHEGAVMPGSHVQEALLDYPVSAADVEESGILDRDQYDDAEGGDFEEEEEDGADSNGAVLEATRRAEGLQTELEKRDEEFKSMKLLLSQREQEIGELKTQLLQAQSVGGGSGVAANGARMQPPPGRAPSGSGLRTESRGGNGRRVSGTTAGRLAQQPPPPNVHLAPDRDKAVNDVVLRLNGLAQAERPPNQGDWNKLKRDIKECQTKLVMSSMN